MASAKMERTEYDAQAETFLTKHGLTFRAAFKGDRCPPWDDDKHVHGDRYRVTIARGKGAPDRVYHNGEPGPRSVSFDFWNSLNDMQKGNRPTAYDVLSCISGDVNCPDTFEGFCSEYGYDSDSRKGYELYQRVKRQSEKLGAFFAADEITDLQEIQ